MRKAKGWRYEPSRHALASKGIKTKSPMFTKKFGKDSTVMWALGSIISSRDMDELINSNKAIAELKEVLVSSNYCTPAEFENAAGDGDVLAILFDTGVTDYGFEYEKFVTNQQWEKHVNEAVEYLAGANRDYYETHGRHKFISPTEADIRGLAEYIALVKGEKKVTQADACEDTDAGKKIGSYLDKLMSSKHKTMK